MGFSKRTRLLIVALCGAFMASAEVFILLKEHTPAQLAAGSFMIAAGVYTFIINGFVFFNPEKRLYKLVYISLIALYAAVAAHLVTIHGNDFIIPLSVLGIMGAVTEYSIKRYWDRLQRVAVD